MQHRGADGDKRLSAMEGPGQGQESTGTLPTHKVQVAVFSSP